MCRHLNSTLSLFLLEIWTNLIKFYFILFLLNHYRVGWQRGERSASAVGGWLGWWWCQWRFLSPVEEGTGEQIWEEFLVLMLVLVLVLNSLWQLLPGLILRCTMGFPAYLQYLLKSLNRCVSSYFGSHRLLKMCFTWYNLLSAC